MFETGQFATLWRGIATDLGLEVEFVPGDWRHGVDPAEVETRLAADSEQAIKAVAVVHNETSTGVTSRIGRIREAIDRAGHSALLLVDVISSLGSIDYRHDEWGVDVTVAGSQKGLMLPPGLSFNAISAKALAAAENSTLPAAYWRWQPMLDNNARLCLEAEEYSDALTAVLLPEGEDADRLRQVILERFDMSLGTGLGKLQGRVFRIGHLGDFNDLMLAGTLCGVEMGLAAAGIAFNRGGVNAALEYLAAAS
jgi:alanine-glyoxylate transaminase/serine-glyoxylate transaminase/serine-pyruvate transaminase